MAATTYALFHSRIIFQHFFREAIWLFPYALRFTSFSREKSLLVKYVINFIKMNP